MGVKLSSEKCMVMEKVNKVSKLINFDELKQDEY